MKLASCFRIALVAAVAAGAGAATSAFAVDYYDPVGGTNATCSVYTPYAGENTLTSGWWVVSGVVTNGTRIKVSGDVNLILVDGSELVATNGIQVAVEGTVTNSLTIWAQSDAEAEGGNVGKLIATAYVDDAGIGGDLGETAGKITVNGGVVSATGGYASSQFKASGADSSQLDDLRMTSSGYALKDKWYYSINAYDDGCGGQQYAITIYSDSARTNAVATSEKMLGSGSQEMRRSINLTDTATFGNATYGYSTSYDAGTGNYTLNIIAEDAVMATATGVVGANCNIVATSGGANVGAITFGLTDMTEGATGTIYMANMDWGLPTSGTTISMVTTVSGDTYAQSNGIDVYSAKTAFDCSVHLGAYPTTSTTSPSYGTFDTNGSGAGIGGGFLGAGGEVVINGGTIRAASTGGQAIGHGINATYSGSLFFPGMKVYASQANMDADNPVVPALRESTCRGEWVGLKVCDPHADRNNDGSCDGCGAALVDLGITKEVNVASGPVYLHDTVVFTITITNSGPCTATCVEVAEVLDPHLEMESYDTWDSYYDIDAGVWYIGDLPRNDWRQLVISAKVTSGGIISNAVSVTYAETDIDLSNNTAAIAGIEAVPTLPPPEITDVRATPGAPWNGKVEICFTVANDPAAACPDWNQPYLSITATDNLTGSNYVSTVAALSGDTGAEAGPHAVTWDLAAQGIDFFSTNVTFTVAYLKMPDYCVIDLSGGTNAKSFAVSYLDAPPEGGWTSLHKTTNLVMRLVAPGTFMMGGSTETEISNAFYCAVFETTQRQWELVTGVNPSSFTNEVDSAMRPVEMVSWNMIRGDAVTYDWPSTEGVDPATFVGVLRLKSGLSTLDLPTEAQWEYACRAGTTTIYSYGDAANGDYMWYYDNSAVGSTRQTHTVGTKLPNAWGLYDMHGNVWEWCLDRRQSSGPIRVGRGGSWYSNASYCASSLRNDLNPSYEFDIFGFRLVRTLSDNPEGERGAEAAAGAARAGTVCAGASASITVGEPPAVSNVVARQRWPWNGLVDVDYEISGYTAGLKAEIVFEEQGGTNRWTATKFFADVEPTLNPGLNRATWDSKAEGATDLVATVVATMRLVREE